MGQTESSSAHALSPEELSLQLAEKFAQKCFSPLELYCFKENFRALADVSNSEGGFLYWSEDTLIRFLGFPATLDVGSIIFQAASNLGAFPYMSLAPAILNFEALVKVVALVTGRYKKALKRHPDRLRFLFRAFAVHDRGVSKENGDEPVAAASEDGYESDESEDLVLDELTVDAKELHSEHHHFRTAHIPFENMRKLIALLLVIAPLEENQPLASLVDRFKPEAIDKIWKATDDVLRGFGELPELEKGIPYRIFRKAIRNSMPFLFDGGLPVLFTQFLFSRNLTQPSEEDREPLLSHTGNIMNLDILSQLSLFISGSRLWRRVRPLYAGSDAGFSLGSFEQRVMKWNAPTIFLVSGTPIPDPPDSSLARAFCDALPPHRYPRGADLDTRVVFGAFIETPWKSSHKDCFGNTSTTLFQLSPTHHVFPASHTSTDYIYFNRDDGFGFGSPPQKWKQSHRLSPYFNIGPVSLILDQSSLEFGVFTHAGLGGAYKSSEIRPSDWQIRFEIDEIEVWGCGGESEAEAQRKAWAWEEREALLRRQINLGKDIESDRALLEMAGLIGQNRSGGSVN